MTAVPTPAPVHAHPSPRRPKPPHRALATAVPHPSSESARLRRLVEAQSLITSELTLTDTLTRIVETACDLTGARYGALGVTGADDRLEQLVQAGADDTNREVADPRTSVAGVQDTMSFLSLPVTVRSQTVGEIYLADADAGRFSADDEELVTALAATAGIAIANARLEEETARSRTWATASHDITRALLADADVDMLLEVVSRALSAAEADMGMLALPDRDGVLRATVTVGLGAERFTDWTFRQEDSPVASIMLGGVSTRRDSLAGLTRPGFDNIDNYGPIMVAPLADADGVRGSVLLIRTGDKPAFTAADLAHFTTFADQVALALDMDDTRNDAEWLRVLEVRHQFAEDLHDNVIQRLFATGMGLHSINADTLPLAAGHRLTRYVAELDDTIDEIRERVFGLRESQAEGRSESRFRHVGVPAAASEQRRPAPAPRPAK